MRKLKSVINIERNSDYEVKFWWRDDDVSDSTEELKILISFSYLNKIPVNLAVIPQKLSNEAVILIKQHSHLSVIQHGYSHTNYANVGDPLNEFGLHRSLEIQLKEIRIGFEKLITVFDDQFVPVFVPPWGHIADSVIELFRRKESLDNFNKKALYILIREMTGLKTQHITRVISVMKKYNVKAFYSISEYDIFYNFDNYTIDINENSVFEKIFRR